MSHWETIGKCDEWYTPKYIFDALGVIFDVDVAASKVKNNTPCYRLIAEDSLEQKWEGFIWMNPPFGGRNALIPWLERFFNHGNGIALVPDRTSAPWFQKYASKADLILFLSPKVKFESQFGEIGKSPSTGTALLGVGELAVNAILGAKKLGMIVKPM